MTPVRNSLPDALHLQDIWVGCVERGHKAPHGNVFHQDDRQGVREEDGALVDVQDGHVDGCRGAGAVADVGDQRVFVLHFDEERVEGGGLVVQRLEEHRRRLAEQGVSARRGTGCSARYLDDGEHALVVVRVGVDLEALRRISVDDGEEGPTGSRGRIVSVVHAQVDHDTGGALLHEGLELGRHTDRAATPGEQRRRVGLHQRCLR